MWSVDAYAVTRLTPATSANRDVDDSRFAPAQVERIAGALMAHERLPVDCEDRSPSAPTHAQLAMPDCKDAAMQRMEPADADATIDRVRRYRELAQLPERHDPALSLGQPCDVSIRGALTAHIAVRAPRIESRPRRRVPVMTYVPSPGRYDAMTYRRCGRSGLQLPAVSLGLWHNFGHDKPLAGSAGDRAPGVRPRRHALRPREQLRSAARLGGGELRAAARDGPQAVSRRADHLLQGRLRHVARAVRRVGLAQVPARLAGPEPRAHGARLRRHLLLAPLRPRHAARGDRRRAGQRGPAGQGALRGHLLLLGRAHARRRRAAARARHARADPPAVVLAAEPLDRARAARRARRGGHRDDRLLAARAGHAHRPSTSTGSRRTRGPRRTASSGATSCPTRTSRACAR